MSKPAMPDAAGMIPPDEPPCREPGQVVSADYLRRGRLRYEAEGREIVGRNGPHFNNRPLYCSPDSEGAALAGDRPLVRLLVRPYVLGHWAAAVARGGTTGWLHDWDAVEARYRGGRMTWRCATEQFPELRVELIAVPLAEGAGFALRLTATGVRPGDRLRWTFGGAKPEEDPKWAWDPVMRGNPDICRAGDPRGPTLKIGLKPEWSADNVATAAAREFRLAANAGASRAAMGCVSDGTVAVRRAAAAAGEEIVGEMALAAGAEIYWVVAADAAGLVPQEAFAAAVARIETNEVARTDTPDARLDAAVASVAHAIDGNYERTTGVFLHGAMAFSIPFIGWRVINGATALGWHDRVARNALYWIARQRREEEPESRPKEVDKAMKQLCYGGPESRFYGRGGIKRDIYVVYDVQSQFFDQTLRDWRASADPTLEAALRPALELHLEWLRECFDPDDDGLYEGCINALPTDSVWYSGGGATDQSAYAFYAHTAAAELARRAGDAGSAARHQARADKIARALRETLWLRERGHFGLFVEQTQRRVHSDAWLYSVFLPVDAAMTTPEESLQSLYYTEWGLERIRLPFGGELCQLSNWVPWKWSVRDMFGGDLSALALAYFQTGLGDEGYELLRGLMHESAYASVTPGAFSHVGAGTDFGDNTHMFARTVMEGLFGYAPDYPNDRVTLRPAFPAAWPRAELATADLTLRYEAAGEVERYHVTLARSAALELIAPVRAERIGAVTLNGAAASWRAEPWFGHTRMIVTAAAGREFVIEIALAGRTAHRPPLQLTGNVGETIAVDLPGVEPGEVRDFHGALDAVDVRDGRLTARLARRPGHHLVLVSCRAGALSCWQVIKLQVTDPAGEARRLERTPREAEASSTWRAVDLAPHRNGDVREIFKQRYLSPRPDTCSVRIGVDGYSPWTFPHWYLQPPEIRLDGVSHLRDAAGWLRTPQGARFAWPDEGRNIMFTSRWDNWPTKVDIPVGHAADVAWALVCGSTFPMQTRIANAELRFRYADGAVERLELVPPLNYWMLCPWGGEDYSYEHDGWCLPPEPPPLVALGENCRAMALSWTLRPGVVLASVTLETLSEEVVVGLMGLSLERWGRQRSFM